MSSDSYLQQMRCFDLADFQIAKQEIGSNFNIVQSALTEITQLDKFIELDFNILKQLVYILGIPFVIELQGFMIALVKNTKRIFKPIEMFFLSQLISAIKIKLDSYLQINSVFLPWIKIQNAYFSILERQNQQIDNENFSNASEFDQLYQQTQQSLLGIQEALKNEQNEEKKVEIYSRFKELEDKIFCDLVDIETNEIEQHFLNDLLKNILKEKNIMHEKLSKENPQFTQLLQQKYEQQQSATRSNKQKNLKIQKINSECTPKSQDNDQLTLQQQEITQGQAVQNLTTTGQYSIQQQQQNEVSLTQIHLKSHQSEQVQTTKQNQEQQQKQFNLEKNLQICCRSYFIYGEMLTQEENQRFEYKNFQLPFNNDIKMRMRKQICAFLNSTGGFIFLGVRDSDYMVFGLELIDEEKTEMQEFFKQVCIDIDPKVKLEKKEINLIFVPMKNQKGNWMKGRWVPKLSIQQGSESHKMYTFPQGAGGEHAYYQRINGQCEPKIGLEYKQKLKERLINGIPKVDYHQCQEPDSVGLDLCQLKDRSVSIVDADSQFLQQLRVFDLSDIPKAKQILGSKLKIIKNALQEIVQLDELQEKDFVILCKLVSILGVPLIQEFKAFLTNLSANDKRILKPTDIYLLSSLVSFIKIRLDSYLKLNQNFQLWVDIQNAFFNLVKLQEQQRRSKSKGNDKDDLQLISPFDTLCQYAFAMLKSIREGLSETDKTVENQVESFCKFKDLEDKIMSDSADIETNEIEQHFLSDLLKHIYQQKQQIKDELEKEDQQFVQLLQQTYEQQKQLIKQRRSTKKKITIIQNPSQLQQQPICCRTYFVYGESLEAIQAEQNKFEFKNYQTPFSTEIKHKLRQIICSFLNTQGGGYIFLGVRDNDYMVFGLDLINKEMDEVNLFFNQICQDFEPKVKLDKQEISLIYMPIKNQKGEWMKGRWVPKVVIKQGSEVHKLYTFAQGSGGDHIYYQRNDRKTEPKLGLEYKRILIDRLQKGTQLVEQHKCQEPDQQGRIQCQLIDRSQNIVDAQGDIIGQTIHLQKKPSKKKDNKKIQLQFQQRKQSLKPDQNQIVGSIVNPLNSPIPQYGHYQKNKMIQLQQNLSVQPNAQQLTQKQQQQQIQTPQLTVNQIVQIPQLYPVKDRQIVITDVINNKQNEVKSFFEKNIFSTMTNISSKIDKKQYYSDITFILNGGDQDIAEAKKQIQLQTIQICQNLGMSIKKIAVGQNDIYPCFKEEQNMFAIKQFDYHKALGFRQELIQYLISKKIQYENFLGYDFLMVLSFIDDVTMTECLNNLQNDFNGMKRAYGFSDKMSLINPQKEVTITNILDNKVIDFQQYLVQLLRWEKYTIKIIKNSIKLKFDTVKDSIIAFDLIQQSLIYHKNDMDQYGLLKCELRKKNTDYKQ